MTKAALSWVFISLIFVLAGCTQSPKATASASPTPDPCSVPVQPLTVDENGELPPNSPTMRDDLQCTETEPNGGRFRMSGRFQRAAYHTNDRPDGIKLEGYFWNYPDSILSVNIYTFSKRMLTGDSSEKRAEQAQKIFDSLPGGKGIEKLSLSNIQISGRPGKQYTIDAGDRKVMIHSVYHDEDNTFYEIVASPTTEADVPTTQKAIDSFIFVTR